MEMTNREKIEMLKSTITYMYQNERRSKSEIARILEVDRTMLTKIMNNEWDLFQESTVSPKVRKWLDTNRREIENMLNNDRSLGEIAEHFSMSKSNFRQTYVHKDKVLKDAFEESQKRIKDTPSKRDLKWKESSFIYEYEDIPGEVWKDILGYKSYQVSNKGRFRSYAKTYNKHYLLQPYFNKTVNYYYVSLVRDDGVTKNLSAHRVVAKTFVEGSSEDKNTVNHIDRDRKNNCSNNLEWMAQRENNQHAYDTGREPAIGYSKNGKFRKILVDGKYEFSSIEAVAAFLKKSPTQVSRYLSGESKTERTFEIIY